MSKPNEKMEALALDVLNRQDLPQDKFGSVIMIIMMIAILVNVIRVIQECNKQSQTDKILLYKQHIRELSSRRGWFTKMRLRKLVRRELNPEDYKKHGWSLVNAILDKGESVTDEEVSTLLEIANV
tara:strand:- start:777 stop:1154 length:378 start_codon:yes stop_codon:yes gene_type:complete